MGFRIVIYYLVIVGARMEAPGAKHPNAQQWNHPYPWRASDLGLKTHAKQVQKVTRDDGCYGRQTYLQKGLRLLP